MHLADYTDEEIATVAWALRDLSKLRREIAGRVAVETALRNELAAYQKLVCEALDDGISRTVSWDDWMDRAEQLTGYDPKSSEDSK